MSEKHSTNGAPVRAVAYYRMSTDRQEASIPEQREAVQALAQRNGYRILREYLDEGVSGDDTERRAGFLSMREDATNRGDFAAILCWDQDRFGRFDTLDAGYWIKPIRDAGVRLVTVAQGEIDWEDFGGRLLYTVQQEGKHQFLRDMSRNVLRGMLAKARRGEWLGGKPPYAYRLDESKRLIIGPPEEVRVVRWLFDQYAHKGATLGDLMDRLNRDGTPSPGGKLWGKTTVHKILQRPVYAGVLAWNRRHDGKYHEVRGGAIAVSGRKKRHRANAEREWVCLDAPQLALVDRATFDRAQQNMVANRDSCTPNRGKRVFLFTGLLFCGECGWPMHGAYQHKGGFNRYICGNYNNHRTRGGCRCNTLVESRILDTLVGVVIDHFQKPEVREALRDEIRRQEEAERQGREDPTASVGARIAELDRKISQGAEKWLTAPPGLSELLGDKLEEWRKERDRLHAQRKELARPAPTLGELDEAVEKILAGVSRLRELDPATAKLVLREVIGKVECRFDHLPYGEARTRSVLTGGTIDIREDVLLCRPVHLGNPLTTVTPARTSPAARRVAARRP
jgi:DNA invertase Pin-like site-specific DNA recombinase